MALKNTFYKGPALRTIDQERYHTQSIWFMHAWTYLFDQMWSLDHKSLISRATFIQHFFYQ